MNLSIPIPGCHTSDLPVMETIILGDLFYREQQGEIPDLTKRLASQLMFL